MTPALAAAAYYLLAIVAAASIGELDAEIAAQGRRSALSRRYDTTKVLALEAAGAARKAMSDAGSAKAQVALDASSLLDEVSAAVPSVESKVWAAKRVPRIRLEVIGPLGQVPDMARRTIDEAGRDIGAGAFAVTLASQSASVSAASTSNNASSGTQLSSAGAPSTTKLAPVATTGAS